MIFPFVLHEDMKLKILEALPSLSTLGPLNVCIHVCVFEWPSFYEIEEDISFCKRGGKRGRRKNLVSLRSDAHFFKVNIQLLIFK